MTSLNISLPEPLREWIEAQVKRGRYGNASEYLRDLIRRDQERRRSVSLGLGAGGTKLEDAIDWAIANEFYYLDFNADSGPNHIEVDVEPTLRSRRGVSFHQEHQGAACVRGCIETGRWIKLERNARLQNHILRVDLDDLKGVQIQRPAGACSREEICEIERRIDGLIRTRIAVDRDRQGDSVALLQSYGPVRETIHSNEV